MRFVWAVLAFVLAAVLIGAGIAQRTIFLGPKEITLELPINDPQGVAMIDGDVLRAHPGEQELVARGAGEVMVAQARTSDLEAWLSGSDYTRISLDGSGSPKGTTVVADPTAGPQGIDLTDKLSASADPSASDLWLEVGSAAGSFTDRIQAPEGVSILVASQGGGSAVAPTDITLSWPLDTTTPWAGPLMVAGGLFMLLGLVLYVLAVRHSRRGRGPRRKGPPPMPPTEPIDVKVKGRRALSADSRLEEGRSQRSAYDAAGRRWRRGLIVLPAIGLSAALLSGCSPDAWPQIASTSSPSPSPTATPDANQPAPAMTEAQAARVLEEASQTMADADSRLDAMIAGTRLAGSALIERTTAYTVRGSVPDYKLPASIPADKIRVLVPQASDSWPKTTLMVVEPGTDGAVAPLILTMTQQNPWANYKIEYIAEMQASVELPDMAPAWMGAKLAPPDSPFLTVAPNELAADFGDVIDNGEASPSAAKFDTTSLTFAKTVQDSRAAIQKALSDSGASATSAMTFDATPGSDAPVAMSSITSGAIVAVTIDDVQTITPTQPGVDIRLSNNPSAKAITGLDSSATGFKTTYGMQLFFSVPGPESKDPITLLATSQQLISVEAIP